jgi:subtilisin family serine protease
VGRRLDGTGQTVAIIDSGVDSSHLMLAGKVVDEALPGNSNCPNGQTQQTDACSAASATNGRRLRVRHARRGTAAGNWPDQNLFGGHAVNVIAVQVFSKFTTSGLQPRDARVRWPSTRTSSPGSSIGCAARAVSIAAANISIGGTYATTPRDADNAALGRDRDRRPPASRWRSRRQRRQRPGARVAGCIRPR